MANLDWGNLRFQYMKTNTVLSSIYHDGEWGPVQSSAENTINISVCSPSFHYGMECFEGLKAFRGVDGKVRIFRMDENAARIKTSTEFLGIPCPPKELFESMCVRAVEENIEFLPPYGHNASLYIRPLVITTIPSLQLVPQQDGILFMVFTIPVGTYSGSGTLKPIRTIMARDFDRAAPHGSGRYKIGGNYAEAMYAEGAAVKMGYHDVLFLDPGTHTYIDEFSSANFFGIRDGRYITPLSDTILPSITNKSLCQVAADLGMEVQRRKILPEEMAGFSEVGQCGTATVITPISVVDDKPALLSPEITRHYEFTQDCGPVAARLYETLTGIQFGRIEDAHGWCTIL